MRLSLAAGAAVAAVGTPLTARAAGRVWFANSSNWNQATNWFNLSGGGQSVPLPGDDAYLTQDDAVDRVVTFDGNFLAPSILLSLTIDATGTGQMVFSQAANRFRAATQYIGDAGVGTYRQSGGTNDAGTMYLGYGGGNGTYALSNTASLNINGALYVGYGGTGTMNQTGGSLSVTNGAELVVAYFPGSSGTYNLSGGTLSTPGLRIGDDASANGSFIQSGGTASVSADLEVASFSAGSAGSYAISGGRLTVGGNILLGEAGSGQFMQSGGTVQLTGGGTNGLMIGLAPVSGTNPASIGSYTLSSGLLSVTGRVYVGFAGNGTFLQTGGQNLINGSLVLASATGTNTSAADYTLQGGTLAVTGVGIIQLNAGGAFTQNGGTLTFTTFNMDGGTVNGTLTNGGTFNYTAGTFAGRLVNAVGSAANFNSDFVAENGMSNAAVLTTGSNRTVTLNGLGLANTGTIQMQGSVLNGSGPLVNSGTLSGFGEIGGTGGFTNNSAWNMAAGDYRLTNTGLNANTGTITVAGATSGVSLVLDGAGVRLNNSGTITLGANASIAGAGALVNLPSGIINAAGGVTVAPASFTNQGTFNVGVGGTGGVTVTPAFLNSGGLVLNGTNNLLSGGTITNTGTILGRGQIGNPVVNALTISQVQPGELEFGGTLVNQLSGQVIVGGGGAIVSANVATNAGTITVPVGGTFAPGALLNTGQVNVAGTLDAGAITNGGTITYTGGAASVDSFGTIANVAGGRVVLGSGSPVVVFYNDVVNPVGAGISVAAGASASFLGNVGGGGHVTNAGTINLSPGKVYAVGELSGGGATALFDGAQLRASRITQGSLTLNASGTVGATVVISPAGTPGTLTSKVNVLTIAGGATPVGKVDLANTNLAIDYSGASPITTARAQLRAGFNPSGAAWTGAAGITSSTAAAVAGTALGYAEASDALGLNGTSTASWQGQTVDATSLLIRYTLAGDATLDGAVDFNDLVKVAQHYNDASGARTWFEGDFNFDGNVDFNDLVMVAQNYNTALPAGAVPVVGGDWALAVASVPEPGIGVGLAGALMLARRRRKR